MPPGDGGGHEVLPTRQADVEAESEGEEVGELDDAEGAGVQFNRHFFVHESFPQPVPSHV